jgi:hypothetical protein
MHASTAPTFSRALVREAAELIIEKFEHTWA